MIKVLTFIHNPSHREYDKRSSLAVEAIQEINNLKQVVTDLDNSVAMATETNQLITEVKGNIFGAELDRLQSEYRQDKDGSDGLLQEIINLDFQPQG